MRVVDAWIRVRIADSGIGLRPEDARRVYEPFFTTKEGGTGLGLAVVKKLVDLYEGSIDCHSAYGEGTSFEVLWPALT